MRLPGIAIRGRIEECWLFVYREPVESVAGLLPPTLSAVTHGGFAFWNIVVCRLRGMRPAGVPATFGLGYWHVGYRLHVRATATSGGPLEGLYFIRSDCDRRIMSVAGNCLTDFHFHLAGVRVVADALRVAGTIESPEAAASFHVDRQAAPRASADSPFPSLSAAANALEYRPAALSPRTPDSLEVIRVRRDAAAWRGRPVSVTDAHWQFLKGRGATLELCYEVEPVEYFWERRQVIPVKPCAS